MQTYHAEKRLQVRAHIAEKRKMVAQRAAASGWKEGWDDDEEEEDEGRGATLGTGMGNGSSRQSGRSRRGSRTDEGGPVGWQRFGGFDLEGDLEGEEEDDEGEVTEEGMYEYFQAIRMEEVTMQVGFNNTRDKNGGNRALHRQMLSTKSTPGPAAYEYEKAEEEERGKRGVTFFATPRFESLEREVKRSTGDSIPRTSTRSRYAPARAPVSRIRTMDDDDDGDDEREEEEGAEEKKEKILNHLFNSARHRYVGVAKDQGERMPM
jgi:hypothetical protein